MTELNSGWDPEQLRALEQPLKCPDCQRPMELRQGANGLFYGCSGFTPVDPACTTTHKAYSEGALVGEPIGRPVPKAVRQLRREAWQLAGRRWNLGDRRMIGQFTKWTAKRLQIPTSSAKLTSLTEVQLTTLCAALVRDLAKLKGGA